MAKREDLLPEDFLDYLLKQVPELGELSAKRQWAVAEMLWDGGSNRRRRHMHFEGAMTYTHQEITSMFGLRGFDSVNARLGLFEKSTNYSMTDGYTFGFWLSTKAERLVSTYLRRQWRTAVHLLRMTGGELQVARNIPPAVSSTGTDGKALSASSATQWKVARHLNLTPVNLDALRRLRRWLQQRLDDIETGRVKPDMFMPLPPDRITYALNYTSKVLRHSITSLAGVGHINQVYQMAPSGRLFAKRINLQNCPTLVKQAALEGLWEYDFSNCHFSIVDHMAAQFGHECEAIRHYLNDKTGTRKAIAEEVGGISEEDAKESLLAILYGAPAGTQADYNAIPKSIGEEAARRLYEVPRFKAIKEDIQKARAVILKNWPRTSNGRLVNAFGKAISVKAPAESRLAHLVQGAEAKALNVALSLHPHKIVLLQHDGFAATERLNTRAIEDAVKAALGFRLSLEESQIRVDPQAQFLKPPANRRPPRRKGGSKVKNSRKPSTGAGSKGTHAS
jgi:hypothetical protein